MPRLDPHSYADAGQPQADHLVWRAAVDFPSRTLRCQATLELRQPAAAATPLDLDTRDLRIRAVTDQAGQAVPFALAEPEPILGSRLRLELPAGTRSVRIDYRTAPEASALQWLEPGQTASGRSPYLYTQCQPIHARSIVPLQDTPRTRLRYEAQITAPRPLTVLMAARRLGSYPDGDISVTHYEMPEPIAPYLFAFAVGEVVRRELGPRTRVWAEAPLIEQAAWEFAETERLLATGEGLFGPYDWQRYDLLVLPPSFPYGGMENPRLTFLTPSLVAGDRSAVAVIAHELAHSWTGNLVSNSNAEHFWLNEGGATYAERRIVEAVWGQETAALEWALGRRGLDEALARQMEQGRPELTCLRTHLDGIDPDEAYSVIPYEKGALFLLALEQAAGRGAFDRFLRGYIDRFRFGALSTEEFVGFASSELSGAFAQVDVRRWLYEPGLPPEAPTPRSSRLEAIQALRGAPPSDAQAQAWSATEWQLFIESIPPEITADALSELDRRFRLTASRNDDVAEKWLTLAVRVGYPAALPRVEELLGRVGRMKYLRPLYRALAQRPETRPMAEAWFAQFAPRYHPIARHVVAGVLNSVSS